MIRNLAAGVQAFTSNTFLVVGDRTVLVDTGANFDIVPRIRRELEELPDDAAAGGDRNRSATLDAVVLTHTHPDHVGNVPEVKGAFDVETWGFDTDQPATDNRIEDEETIQLGDHDYLAVHTPGHKNDHLCFYAPGPGILFAGDLVFQNGGFGRTDLAEGDRQTLTQSIDRIHALVGDDVTEMHVGHGPSVTRNPSHDIELARQAARMGR
ncbi:Zn-dependent hydrolase, glyoxylase [Halalkaliarchaeum desulfuricum]|uniref:Zn-dependent hydrolase, glyoxylase n=1 Tax=Halalkaliarchaeum desulfuricum TaxID=2055893 RepID=A0A343TL53_9EURY|nr:MBL fold metallo-hydrolase [Halalkaliarchaeum desulfuricum]AUX09825.1 Zn-dependent hydrolase, glyoxylase [Halalkaliarchaeum desulfuricum]